MLLIYKNLISILEIYVFIYGSLATAAPNRTSAKCKSRSFTGWSANVLLRIDNGVSPNHKVSGYLFILDHAQDA